LTRNAFTWISMKCHSFVLNAVPRRKITHNKQPIAIKGRYWLMKVSQLSFLFRIHDRNRLSIGEFSRDDW
jgi:hypothetical protein